MILLHLAGWLAALAADPVKSVQEWAELRQFCESDNVVWKDGWMIWVE